MKAYLVMMVILLLVNSIMGVQVRVITPNGGEQWRVGSTQTIEWWADMNFDIFYLLYTYGCL